MKDFVIATLGNLTGMCIVLLLWKFLIYKKNRRNDDKETKHK